MTRTEEKVGRWLTRLAKMIEGELGLRTSAVKVVVQELPKELTTCNPLGEPRVVVSRSTLDQPPWVILVVLAYHLLLIAWHNKPYVRDWETEVERILGCKRLISGAPPRAIEHGSPLARLMSEHRILFPTTQTRSPGATNAVGG